ncbi:MAG: hypothetical protein LUF32_03000 [Clostridiales bacterium]|nr:hypothetical protein [Clostridiales bacterium]
MKSIYKRILALLAVALMAVSLTGCKESLAFQQIEYNQDFPDTVDDDQLVDNDEENDIEDEDIFSTDERDDSDTERHFDESEQMQDDDTDNDTAGANTTYNSNAASIGESSSSGTEDSSGNTSTNGTASDSGTNTTGSGDGESNDANSAGLGEGDDGDSEYNAGETGGEGSQSDEGSILDSGEDSTNTVIATGEAAIMVQMLGGKGALAATDQETYNAMSAYFPSAELEGIQILWDSNAAGGINTSKLSSFLSEATQTVVYLYDYSDVNTSDISTLSASGVGNAALKFTTYNNMLSAADTVVSNLGTDTASEQRDAYKTFCSEIAEAVGEYDSAKYTLYVSGWDSGEQLTLSSVTGTYTWSSQYGVGIAAKLSNSPANSLWKLAGIYNNYSVSTSTSRGTKPAVSSYSYAYISQYSFVGNVSQSTGNYVIESNGNVLVYNLGSESYPALITASQEVYDALMNDKEKSVESGSMMNLVTTTNASGSRSLVVNGKATDITAVIAGDYAVYVNPDGLGDWIGGSAESILETAWSAWRIQGIYSEDQVNSAIKEFYKTFYRCELSDGQLQTILAGKES